MSRVTVACLSCIALMACSSSESAGTQAEAGDAAADSAAVDDTLSADADDSATPPEAMPDSTSDASPDADADADAPSSADDLSSNRDRLLGTYYTFLKTSVTTPQSNGLSGASVSSVCDVWTKLAPSPRAVFLTLTARMQGSKLRVDGSSMLSHVVKVYRIVGGDGSTATDPGSCGGGEANRMIMSMDAVLQAAQKAASDHKGAKQSDGKYDIADASGGTFWRDSHDLGGAHAPFDISDETDQGAPRGQTQYFKDPTSMLAKSPLGRQDLATLVDPLALEMDQDYDCVHNSNPSCSYVTYGPACFPETSKSGTDIYTSKYGSIEPAWKPKDCGP
ncbi:MAG: hypothetical protein ACXWUG_20075 [Polyangiales bacterium]